MNFFYAESGVACLWTHSMDKYFPLSDTLIALSGGAVMKKTSSLMPLKSETLAGDVVLLLGDGAMEVDYENHEILISQIYFHSALRGNLNQGVFLEDELEFTATEEIWRLIDPIGYSVFDPKSPNSYAEFNGGRGIFSIQTEIFLNSQTAFNAPILGVRYRIRSKNNLSGIL